MSKTYRGETRLRVSRAVKQARARLRRSAAGRKQMEEWLEERLHSWRKLTSNRD
jgi:hypothetical protein